MTDILWLGALAGLFLLTLAWCRLCDEAWAHDAPPHAGGDHRRRPAALSRRGAAAPRTLL